MTIDEIAAAAGVTASAVYYHFASRDDILRELVEDIGVQVVDCMAGGDPFADLLAWTHRHRDAARVYFVSSVGASPAVEAVRREQQREMVAVLAPRVAAAGSWSPVETDVAAIALVTLYTEAIVQALAGARRHHLRAAVGAIAERITGAPQP